MLLLLSSLFLLLLLRCLILSIADPAWQAGSCSDCNCEIYSWTSRRGIFQRSRFFENQKKGIPSLTDSHDSSVFFKIPLATHLRYYQHTLLFRKQFFNLHQAGTRSGSRFKWKMASSTVARLMPGFFTGWWEEND